MFCERLKSISMGSVICKDGQRDWIDGGSKIVCAARDNRDNRDRFVPKISARNWKRGGIIAEERSYTFAGASIVSNSKSIR